MTQIKQQLINILIKLGLKCFSLAHKLQDNKTSKRLKNNFNFKL